MKVTTKGSFTHSFSAQFLSPGCRDGQLRNMDESPRGNKKLSVWWAILYYYPHPLHCWMLFFKSVFFLTITYTSPSAWWLQQLLFFINTSTCSALSSFGDSYDSWTVIISNKCWQSFFLKQQTHFIFRNTHTHDVLSPVWLLRLPWILAHQARLWNIPVSNSRRLPFLQG